MCPAYPIPFQAALVALRLLQSIEKPIPQLRVRYQKRKQQKEIARQRHGFISVRPWLQIDCCGGEEATEEEDKGEGWDYGDDADDPEEWGGQQFDARYFLSGGLGLLLDLLAWIAEMRGMQQKLDGGEDEGDGGEGTTKEDGEIMECHCAGDVFCA